MDYLTIILITVGALALVGLAWMSGYDIGKASERQLANRRVNGVLDELNKLKPRVVTHVRNPRRQRK